MIRTHTCNDLREVDVGKRVVLTGWAKGIREHGRVTFIDLWDRYGITQIVVDKDLIRDLKIHKESVVRVEGTVQLRSSPNPHLPTGKIEVRADKVEVLSLADKLPMEIGDPNNTDYTRLKYRYLDLRRNAMLNNLITRHRIVTCIREYLNSNGFVEVETPILAKSTPEGARDFLVPSRLHRGKFYALPQSPQLFKQLLMISGLDRYYQIARCFRDEDLRADRQLEFTQVDIEMSFVEESDIMDLIEGMMVKLFKEVLNIELDRPFPRMTYEEAMSRFGTDKPDLRFGLELVEITDVVRSSEFRILSNAESVICIKVGPSADTPEVSYSRKEIDKLVEYLKPFGAKGLIYLKLGESGLEGPMAKKIDEQTKEKIVDRLGMKQGDSVFIVADKRTVARKVLGELRNVIGQRLGLKDKRVFKFVWITDFPMFEYNEEEGRYETVHHPFTQPKITSYDELKDKENCKARAYDIVLNGEELGGGSIRINTIEMQKKVFEEIGIDEKTAREKFGFLLEALRYGAPPHGGIALGLDRLVAMMLGLDDIRETIAFPKTKSGEDPMLGAPSEVSDDQLIELGIRLTDDG